MMKCKNQNNICDSCGREFYVEEDWQCPHCGFDNKPCAETRMSPKYREKVYRVDAIIGNMSKKHRQETGHLLTNEEKAKIRKELMNQPQPQCRKAERSSLDGCTKINEKRFYRF